MAGCDVGLGGEGLEGLKVGGIEGVQHFAAEGWDGIATDFVAGETALVEEEDLEACVAEGECGCGSRWSGSDDGNVVQHGVKLSGNRGMSVWVGWRGR